MSKIETIISSWRKLSPRDRHEVSRQISVLIESQQIETSLSEELLFAEPDKGSDTKTTHSVVCGDICSDKIIKVIPSSIDIVFTSPPYNANIEYDKYKDNLLLSEYLEFTEKWLIKCDRFLSPGGRLVVNIRDLTTGIKGSRYPAILAFYPTLCEKMNYKWRGQHIWYKGREESSTGWGSWCSSANPAIIDLYEYVFVFQKQGDRVKGKDDIEKTQFVESVLGVWKIRPVKKFYKQGNILNHPCPFPSELVRRVLRLYSHVGDTVLDPFAGILSTAIAAAEVGRNSISIDLSEFYCQEGIKRLRSSMCLGIETDINYISV